MKQLNIFFFAVLFIAVSCKKDEKATYIDGVGTTSAGSVQAKNNASRMLMPVNQNANSSVSNIQTVSPQGNVATTPGTNPPHGKPGHRCDIAVGAPLNSPSTGKTQATPQQNQQISINPAEMKTSVAPATKQKTAPGMNPPHGEPGHRCDIAVGAPLNSSVSKTTTTTTPTTTNTAVSKSLPATVSAPTTYPDANGKALAVNPAHGEPGHRCDIAVGAPLK